MLDWINFRGLESAIQWINLCAVDNKIGFLITENCDSCCLIQVIIKKYHKT